MAYEYNGMKFNEEQFREIEGGLESGVDVDIYANTKFDWEQMWELKEALKVGLDLSEYANKNYSSKELKKIRESKVKINGEEKKRLFKNRNAIRG